MTRRPVDEKTPEPPKAPPLCNDFHHWLRAAKTDSVTCPICGVSLMRWRES